MSEAFIKGEKLGLVFSIVIYISSIVFFGAISESTIPAVFVGLLPFLLYIGLFFYSVHIRTESWILWLLPLIMPALFLISFGFIESTLDVPTLAVLNVILSYFINIVVLMIIGLRHIIVEESKDRALKKEIHGYNKHIHELKSRLDSTQEVLDSTRDELHGKHHELVSTKEQLHEAHTKLRITRENFSITLRSIEDKCKAINFVIGRVYSDKRGANPVIRQKLRIDTEWYNDFSTLSSNYKEEDADKLLRVLAKIFDKLVLFEEKEHKLFKIGKAKLPIIRKDSDTVLDVMARNDKDPVEYYHHEAKEVCLKLTKFLKENTTI